MNEAKGKDKWIRPVVAVSAALLLVSSAIILVGQMMGPDSKGADRPTNDTPWSLPDFSVTTAGISFSEANPTEGDDITINAVVHNIGGLSGTASVEFWDDVCEGCDGRYLIGLDDLGQIEPGGSGVASVVWSTSGQRGDNVITVVADYDYTVLESEESNNVAMNSIHVEEPMGPPVTVTVTSPLSGLEWTGGTLHTLGWKLVGDPQVLDVVIDYSEDAGVTWEFVHEGQYWSGPDGPNATKIYNWIVPKVNTTTALVRVCATDDVNVTTCDESSPYFTIDSIRPRLVTFDPPDGAINVPINYPINVYFDEGMQGVEGSLVISPSFPIYYYQKHNSTWWTFYLDPFQYSTLYTWGLTCTARDDSSPGNKLENCPVSYSFMTVNAPEEPDLTVSSSDIHFSNDAPVEGQTIVITANVHNIGGGEASDVLVRVDDVRNANETVTIGYSTIPFIGAGGVGNASVTWIAFPEGLHTIVVTVDPSDNIPEENENNNVASRQINVGQSSPPAIFVQAVTFDNDNDGKFDDVVILVYDDAGHVVEGAAVYIDGALYAYTPETGILLAYDFSLGTHHVYVEFGGENVSATFYSEGQ